jgi:cytochrome oxidase assembly protein ShyY1
VYRFLLKPRWIAFTLLIAMLMVSMLGLAKWQGSRYHEKVDRRDLVEARLAQPAVDVTTVIDPTMSTKDADTHEWTIVTATGRYDAAGQVLIRNRSQGGFPGYHVVTPLVLDSGALVLVNRGFIPLSSQSTPPAPPSGPVSLNGRLHNSQTRGSFGPTDPTTGVLTELARVDVARIAKQLDAPVLPSYIELVSQEPAVAAGDPKMVDAPDIDLGPHLSYAGQWVIFTLCALAGWIIVVRRTARKTMGAKEIVSTPAAPTDPTAPSPEDVNSP